MSLDIHSVPSVAAGQMDPTVEPEGVEFVLRHMTGAECLSEREQTAASFLQEICRQKKQHTEKNALLHGLVPPLSVYVAC